MNFEIIYAASLGCKVDRQMLDLVHKKTFGNQVGISVASEFKEFEKSLLTIVTEIKYIALKSNDVFTVATGNYSSNFLFDSIAAFSNVPGELAIDTLKKCHDLAQAHAYSIFSIQSTENDVPQSGMELTPLEKYDYKISEFLKRISNIK